MYFLSDSEEGNKSEMPSSCEVGPMYTPLYCIWARNVAKHISEMKQEKFYSLGGYPSSMFTLYTASCLILRPVFVAVIKGAVY